MTLEAMFLSLAIGLACGLALCIAYIVWVGRGQHDG